MEEKQQKILDFMNLDEYVPMKAKEIAMFMEVPKEQYNEFLEILEKLESEMKIQKNRKNRYRLAEKIYYDGIYRKNQKGFGFVKIDDQNEEIYISKDNSQNALNGDRVLIAEGCVHHRQCNDIGTKKIPAWIEKYSNAKPEYTFVSGGDFPNDLSAFKLIVHCGGCMLNEAEMKNRILKAKEARIPIVNYGMAIAQMNGILERAMKVVGGEW